MEEVGIISGPSLASSILSGVSPVAVDSKTAPHASLHHYFGVLPGDPMQEAQLAKIWEFAVTRAGTEDTDKVVDSIRAMRATLGVGKMGDQPWAKLSAYIAAIGDLKRSEATIRELTI